MTSPNAARHDIERGLAGIGAAFAAAFAAPLVIRIGQHIYAAMIPESLRSVDPIPMDAGGFPAIAAAAVVLVLLGLVGCGGAGLTRGLLRLPAVEARVRAYAAKAPEREKRRQDRALRADVRRYMRRTGHELKVRRHLERMGLEVPPALPSEEAFPIVRVEEPAASPAFVGETSHPETGGKFVKRMRSESEG